jgi:hypothetical protein
MYVVTKPPLSAPHTYHMFSTAPSHLSPVAQRLRKTSGQETIPQGLLAPIQRCCGAQARVGTPCANVPASLAGVLLQNEARILCDRRGLGLLKAIHLGGRLCGVVSVHRRETLTTLGLRGDEPERVSADVAVVVGALKGVEDAVAGLAPLAGNGLSRVHEHGPSLRENRAVK